MKRFLNTTAIFLGALGVSKPAHAFPFPENFAQCALSCKGEHEIRVDTADAKFFEEHRKIEADLTARKVGWSGDIYDDQEYQMVLNQALIPHNRVLIDALKASRATLEQCLGDCVPECKRNCRVDYDNGLTKKSYRYSTAVLNASAGYLGTIWNLTADDEKRKKKEGDSYQKTLAGLDEEHRLKVAGLVGAFDMCVKTCNLTTSQSRTEASSDAVATDLTSGAEAATSETEVTTTTSEGVTTLPGIETDLEAAASVTISSGLIDSIDGSYVRTFEADSSATLAPFVSAR